MMLLYCNGQLICNSRYQMGFIPGEQGLHQVCFPDEMINQAPACVLQNTYMEYHFRSCAVSGRGVFWLSVAVCVRVQDYSNNTLVVPPRPPQLPEAMNCIMYYTSCADSGGATTAVSKRESGQAMTPRTYSVVDDWPVRRSKHHALYAKEQAVEYRPGTALLYSMDTLHRGTPVKEGGVRVAHHLVVRR